MSAPGMFRGRALQKLSSPEHLDQMLSVTPPRRWVALTALLAAVAAAVVWSTVSNIPTTLTGIGYLVPQDGLRSISAPASGTLGRVAMSVGEHVVTGQRLGTVRVNTGRVYAIAAPAAGVVTETNAAPNEFVAAGSRVGSIEPVGFPLEIYAYVDSQVAADLHAGETAHVLFSAGIGQQFGYAVGTVNSVGQFAVTPQQLAFILGNSSTVNSVLKLGSTNEVEIALEPSATTPSGLVWGSGDGPPGPLPAGISASVTFVLGQHHPIGDVF